MRRSRGLLLSIGCLVLLTFTASGCADGLFYRPTDGVYAAPSDYHPTVEELAFAAPEGPRLHGWWLTSRTGTTDGVVVYCHGNHANLSLHARYASWLTGHGFDVMVFDYRGYGRSEGSPSREGTVADTLAAIDFALAREPDRTVVFGHSLGGALGIVGAAARPAVRGVIAESAFASYRGIARDKASLLAFLVPLLVSSGYDPIESLAALPPRALLIVHGARDRIVPVAHAHELFDRAGEPKQLYIAPRSGHATPWVDEGADFESRIVEFVRSALGR